MTALSPRQRQKLRGLAHDLKPVVQIGKNGLNESVLVEIDRSLDGHELIKVRFVDFKTRKRELCDAMAEASGAHWVGLIGNVAIFYRPHEDASKRKIRLGRA